MSKVSFGAGDEQSINDFFDAYKDIIEDITKSEQDEFCDNLIEKINRIKNTKSTNSKNIRMKQLIADAEAFINYYTEE